MYKSENENVEVYFICYKKEEMELVESYYDKILNIHYWYFNAYLAYRYWKNHFKGLSAGELSKKLLIVAASRYLIYMLENKEYKSSKECKILKKDLEKIDKELKIIIEDEQILSNL